MQIKEAIDKIESVLREVEDIVKDVTGNVPDNPEVTRINKQCFTVRSTDIAKHSNLSPEFYDWGATAKLIREYLLPVTQLRVLYTKLRELLRKGAFKVRKWQGQTVKIHPDLLIILREKFETLLKEEK